MDERERQSQLLDRYWDVLDRDPAAAPPDELDPAAAAVTRQLVAALRPAAPDATFTAQLRQRLIAAAATTRPADATTLSGRTSSAPTRHPGARAGWRVLTWGAGRLAAVAAVLALLLATVLLLRGLPQRDALTQPTVAPTPQASPIPTSAAIPTVGSRATPIISAATPRATPAASNTWQTVGAMSVARSGHTATLLNDGRVLVVGGSNGGSRPVLASAEYFDPATASWSPAAPLAAPRTGHTATLLRDGRVLVVGGSNGKEDLRTAELYDPVAAAWSPAAPLSVERVEHRAVALRDGTVLVVGQQNTAERYDPATNSWSAAGALAAARTGVTFALLSDGDVLAIGGTSNDGSGPRALATVERYDLATNRWLPASPMTTERVEPSVVGLPNGRVLAIGGSTTTANGWQILGSTEQYDPATRVWTTVAALNTPRAEPVATVLADGSVLVTGGHYYGNYGNSGDPNTAERYDPATDAWTTAGRPMTVGHRHTATLLRDGRVLVAGGELLSGNSGQWFASAVVYVPGATAAPTPTVSPVARPLVVGDDRTVAAPFQWIGDGQRPDYTPQLAPDERRIAYFVAIGTPPANRLLVYDIASGAAREITSEQGPLYASVRWSPGTPEGGWGQRLAYVKSTRNGEQGVVAELVVTDSNLGNPRVVYRFDDPQATGGPPFAAVAWSADGQRVRIGGTVFGTFRALRWVNVDASGSEEIAITPPHCGVAATVQGAVVASSAMPDGRATVCIVKASALATRPATIPADGLALVRVDGATGQLTALAPVAGEPNLAAISPDGTWIVVGFVERTAGTSPGFERRLRLAVIRGDGFGGLRSLGGDPYDPVQFSSQGLTWAADGRAYLIARPVNGANHSSGYLYELDAPRATMRAVTRDWETSDLLGTTRDGRRVLLVRGEPGNPELHLIGLIPGGAAPAPTAAPAPAPVPAAAVAAARTLMDARIARDEVAARAALTPDLAVRLAAAELLPPADRRWTDYRVVAVVRAADGRVQIAVQIYAPASFLEQIITLEERAGRWLVANLDPLTAIR